MAIVKYGGGIVGIRGTTGGNTFSANTNGNYVKTWARPRNPRSYGQTLNRYLYQQWPAAWRALSDEQRTDWNDYAALHPLTNSLGEEYYRSGFQWFTHCNQNLIVTEGTPIADAPVGEQPDTIEPNSLTYDDSGVPYTVAVNFDEHAFDGVFIVIFAHVLPFSGNMSWPTRYDLLRYLYDPGEGVTLVDSWSQHAAKYGPPQLGYKWFAHVVTQTTEGLRSSPWPASIEYTKV